MKRILPAVFLSFSILFGLTACSSNENDSGSETETASDAVIYTDDCGRQVLLPKQINRIVPSSTMAQIILFALAPDLFAGLPSEWHENSRGIIADAYFELPVFGSLYNSADLNLEELALSAPELIIDIGEAKDSIVDDLDTLQNQTQIPCIFISADFESMPETFRKLGSLLGREEKAEELASFCERIYHRTLSIMEAVGNKKINTLYVLGEDGLNVLASSSYHAQVLDLLTNNLAVVEHPMGRGTGNEVTMEQILLWNPDFVLFAPDSIYEHVLQMDSWRQTNAVANTRYLKVPDIPDNWMGMPPSVQCYLGLIWLPSELYPEYCDYDAKGEILEYYRLFYGCSLTDEQYETITRGAFLP